VDLGLSLEVLRREEVLLCGEVERGALVERRAEAMAELRLGGYSRAAHALRALLRAHPASLSLTVDAGCLADLMGDAPLARSYLSRALDLSPRCAVVEGLYAHILAREDAGAADVFVERALARHPTDNALLFIRARLLHEREGAEAALSAYEVAFKANERGLTLSWYARAAQEAGEVTLARTLAELACERYGDDERIWLLCGELRARAGEERAARSAFERALRLNPHLLRARYSLGVLLSHKEPRAALKHLRYVAPYAPEVHLELARLALRLGRKREAQEQILSLLSYEGTLPAERCEEGRALLRQLSGQREGSGAAVGLWRRLLGRGGRE
jgi:predicted Zn-dependent protease